MYYKLSQQRTAWRLENQNALLALWHSPHQLVKCVNVYSFRIGLENMKESSSEEILRFCYMPIPFFAWFTFTLTSPPEK